MLVSFDSIDMESSLAAAPVDGAKVGELTVKGCEVLAKDIITVDVAMENDDDNKNDDDDDDPENNDENKKEDEADDRACEDFVGLRHLSLARRMRLSAHCRTSRTTRMTPTT